MEKGQFNQYLLKIIAKDVDNHTVEKFGLVNNYVWYAFSNDILSCLSDDLARKKFDNVPKDSIDVFLYKCEFINGTPKYFIEQECNYNVKNITSKTIDNLEAIEVYIVDKMKKWCYIRTHEEDFGPYFYEI